jgi:amidase
MAPIEQSFSVNYSNMTTTRPPYQIEDWRAAAASKRASLQSKIPNSHLLPPELAAKAANRALLPDDPRVLACGVLNILDIEITNIEDSEILSKCHREGKYSSVQVTEAFTKRASIAQQCCNCLTEVLYDDAMERAKQLDQHLATTGQTVGLLHGLPVSLKVFPLLPAEDSLS